MRVLFTNIQLYQRTGTELFVRDMSDELTRRGHEVAVYSPTLGCIADEVRALGITVTDNLSALEFEPDLIHARHRFETMEALIRFPKVPAIFACHDPYAWHDNPVLHPRILRYLTVDTATHQRLIEAGIPHERIQTILNFANLRRFKPRDPLPEKPRRVLLFSNNARSDTYLPAVEEACRTAHLKLDVIGFGVGQPCSTPEKVIGDYDIVIAKGKSAIESLAVGATVILCDNIGLGPMVNSRNFDELRRHNFGHGATPDKVSSETLLKRIKEYNPHDAQLVRDRLRTEGSLEKTANKLIILYQQILDEYRSNTPIDPKNESRLHTAFIHEMLGSKDLLRHRFPDRSIEAIKFQLEAECAVNMKLLKQVYRLEHSLTFRLRKRLRRVPGLIRLVDWCAKLFRKK